MSKEDSKLEFKCSIYNNRPITCHEYPWNFANRIFAECIFVDENVSPMRLRPIEEQLTMNTEKEISDYCVSCGRCCFFGPGACDKLIVSPIDGTKYLGACHNLVVTGDD
jgi:Fe-S-cluster containining protein